MEIPYFFLPKHYSRRTRQHRITEIFVKGLHGARSDSTLEAVTHHELITVAQLRQKRSQIRKVVAVIGVSHDDVLTSRGCDSSQQGAAVAFSGNVNYASSDFRRDGLRSVRAAIVRNQHFPIYPVLVQ